MKRDAFESFPKVERIVEFSEKDVRENRILYDNSRCNTWHYNFYNKPLKELNIVDISELEDDYDEINSSTTNNYYANSSQC